MAGLHELTNGVWISVELPPSAAFASQSEPWCSSPEADSQPVSGTPADALPLPVHAVWVDAQNGLWIGTPYGAARRSHANLNCWTLFPTFTSEGTPALVQTLVGTGEGSIWAVTDGGGALLFEEYGAVTLAFGRDVPGNLNTNFVRDVAIDQDGAVWFAACGRPATT